MENTKFTIADVTKPLTEVAFSLAWNIDEIVSVRANGINILWFDPDDGTVNLSYVGEKEQALLPGLKFDKDKFRVLLYAN